MRIPRHPLGRKDAPAVGGVEFCEHCSSVREGRCRADPVCVCELVAPLGPSQPTVSHHLKRLVDAGLLQREQRGRWAYDSLDRQAMARLAAVTDRAGGTR